MASAGETRLGGLEIRDHEHKVLYDGREVSLSSREYEIVAMLAEHPGWVLSAEELSEDPGSANYSPESVSVLVSRLRRKLAEAGAPVMIETARGVGYRLRTDPSSEDAVDSADCREGLRDTVWQLLEAAIEAEHSGTHEQQRAVTELLERARRDIFAILAE